MCVSYISYATSCKRGSFYSLIYIHSIKLQGDSLEGFLRVWEMTIQGLAEPQTERNLQRLLAEQLRKSKRMEMDMAFYDRDESLEGPCFSYSYLLQRLRAVMEYTRVKTRRTEQLDGLARQGGTTAAFAPKAKPKPKATAKSRSASLATPEKGIRKTHSHCIVGIRRKGLPRRGYRFVFNRGCCASGKECKWEHKEGKNDGSRSASPPVTERAKMAGRDEGTAAMILLLCPQSILLSPRVNGPMKTSRDPMYVCRQRDIQKVKQIQIPTQI